MFNEFYGLTVDPFRLSPDPRFCYRHRNFARAKAYMQYALHQGEGFVMVTGQPGTGKTTLIEDLLADTSTDKVRVARMSSTQVAADDLLRLVADAFDIDASTSSKATILLNLQAVMIRQMESGRNSLLIVDEAQNLPFESMEELRMITNLQLGARPLMQVFLVGQDGLNAIIGQPRMEQLQQRILAACRMEPLGPEETRDYLHHRLRCAGWSGRPSLTGEAVAEIHQASHGIPRRINLLASRLLLYGCLEERLSLNAEDVRLVTEELKGELLISFGSATSSSPGPLSPPGLAPDFGHLAIEAVQPAVAPEPAPPVVAQAQSTSPEASGEATGGMPSGEPEAPATSKTELTQPETAQVEADGSPPPRPSAGERPQGQAATLTKAAVPEAPLESDVGTDLAPSDAVPQPVAPTAPEPQTQDLGTGLTPPTSDAPIVPADLADLAGARGDLPATSAPVEALVAEPPAESAPPGATIEPERMSESGSQDLGLAQTRPAARPRGERRGRWVAAVAGLVLLGVVAVLVLRPNSIGDLKGHLGPLSEQIDAVGAKAVTTLRAAGTAMGLAPALPASKGAPSPSDPRPDQEGFGPTVAPKSIATGERKPASRDAGDIGPVALAVPSEVATKSVTPSAEPPTSAPGQSAPALRPGQERPANGVTPPPIPDPLGHRQADPAAPSMPPQTRAEKAQAPSANGPAGLPMAAAAPSPTSGDLSGGSAEPSQGSVAAESGTPDGPPRPSSAVAGPDSGTARNESHGTSHGDEAGKSASPRLTLPTPPLAGADTPSESPRTAASPSSVLGPDSAAPDSGPGEAALTSIPIAPSMPEAAPQSPSVASAPDIGAAAGKQPSAGSEPPSVAMAAQDDPTAQAGGPKPAQPTETTPAPNRLSALEDSLVAVGFQPERLDNGGLKLVMSREVPFGAGSTEISPTARRAIERLGQALADLPTAHLRIIGHTDDSGPADYNASLSLQRAKGVAALLTAHGVSAERIESEGRGEDEPMTVQSIDGIPPYLMNRRIEVFIRDTSQP